MKRNSIIFLAVIGLSACCSPKNIIDSGKTRYYSEQLEKIKITKERMKEVGLSFVENQDEEKINQFILSGKAEKEIKKMRKLKRLLKGKKLELKYKIKK